MCDGKVSMYNDGVLYILPRKDMDSLNHAGKMGAQIAHAAHHAADLLQRAKFGTENRNAWMLWEKSTDQAFGTTIVLGAELAFGTPVVPGTQFHIPLTLERINDVVNAAINVGYAAGVVFDPTYPLQDGQVTHLIPIATCGWIFGSKASLESVLKYLKLHGPEAAPIKS